MTDPVACSATSASRNASCSMNTPVTVFSHLRAAADTGMFSERCRGSVKPLGLKWKRWFCTVLLRVWPSSFWKSVATGLSQRGSSAVVHFWNNSLHVSSWGQQLCQMCQNSQVGLNTAYLSCSFDSSSQRPCDTIQSQMFTIICHVHYV